MEGYVKGRSKKELSIAPFVEYLKLWERFSDDFYRYFEQNA